MINSISWKIIRQLNGMSFYTLKIVEPKFDPTFGYVYIKANLGKVFFCPAKQERKKETILTNVSIFSNVIGKYAFMHVSCFEAQIHPNLVGYRYNFMLF